MNFVKEFMGKSAQQKWVGATLHAPLAGVREMVLPYHFSSVRWHGDSRKAIAVVFVHDLLSSSSHWTPLVRAMGRIPALPHDNGGMLTPTDPLELYAVDLRFHGANRGATVAADVDLAFREDHSFAMQCAHDVGQFCSQKIHSSTPVHLVGAGMGAQVCALLALASQRYSSATLITSPQDSFTACKCLHSNQLTLLRQMMRTMSPSSTLADLNAALKDSVPNPWDRFVLLDAVQRQRDAPLVLHPEVEMLANRFVKWSPVATSNAVAPSFRCTLVHHGNQSHADDAAVLQKHFPALAVTQMARQPLSCRDDSDDDVQWTVQLLSNMNLIKEELPVDNEQQSEELAESRA